jgi:nicotinamidase-related amidase
MVMGLKSVMATAANKIVFWEVDAQQDFMLPGGKLYVPGAEKIIPNIKRLVVTAQKAGILLVSSACAHTATIPNLRVSPFIVFEKRKAPVSCPKGLQRTM